MSEVTNETKENLITEHITGKLLVIPDALFRSPLNEMDSRTTKDVELYINKLKPDLYQTSGNSKHHTQL